MMRINVYAENHGWLFEDMKSWFRRLTVEGTIISVSDLPDPAADAWVALRTREAGLSPVAGRTVACVHDLYDYPGLYHPAGGRGAVHMVGGLVLCNPLQRPLLVDAGINVEGKRVLERPLGALSIFTLRESMPEKFTIGWVGRKDARKRTEWLIETLRLVDIPRDALRVLLAGEDLEGLARELGDDGIDHELIDRRVHPIESCPPLYHAMDALLITSMTEAGPLTLFEALASGLPVVSTPVGWAPYFAGKSPGHVLLADSPAMMAAHLCDIRHQRAILFGDRHAIAGLVRRWRLDDWYPEVIRLAASLVSDSGRDGAGGNESFHTEHHAIHSLR
ncbi:MAG: capsule polysaccharide biosynthesis family protein [Chlorobi bacterium]|nr:capsule polysaccharide biosynthesis family protein [Chlorobiota bacterium]